MTTKTATPIPTLRAVPTPQMPRGIIDDSLRGIPRAAIRIWRHGQGESSVSLATAVIADGSRTALSTSIDLGAESDASASLAAVDLFGQIYRWAEDAGRRVMVYVGHPGVRRQLREIAEAFPHVVMIDDLYTASGRLLQPLYIRQPDPVSKAFHDLGKQVASQKLAETKLKAAQQRKKVTVYTDGSVRTHRRGCGVGAVTTDGVILGRWISSTPASPTLAELLAIEMAIDELPHNTILIRTDSQDAIALIGRENLDRRRDNRVWDALGGSKIQDAVDRIKAKTAGRKLRLEWVRSHSGDPLNEAADRIAVTERRFGANNVTGIPLAQVIAQISDDVNAHLEGLAAA